MEALGERWLQGAPSRARGAGWGRGDTAVARRMDANTTAAGDEVPSLPPCPAGAGQTRKNKLKI